MGEIKMRLQEYRHHYWQGIHDKRADYEQWWGPPKEWDPTPNYNDHVYWYNLGLPLQGKNKMWYRRYQDEHDE